MPTFPHAESSLYAQSETDEPADLVFVTSLSIDTLTLKPAPWSPDAGKSQPAVLDVFISTDVSEAGATEDLTKSINYSFISKGLRSYFKRKEQTSRTFTVYELALAAAEACLFHLDPSVAKFIRSVCVKASLPDALLHGGNLSSTVSRCAADFLDEAHCGRNAAKDTLLIEHFTISTILGLNDCERLEEQPLEVIVESWPNVNGLQASDSMAWNAKLLQTAVFQHVKASHPLLLETFAPSLAQAVITNTGTAKVRVNLQKPKANLWTRTTGVQVVRSRDYFLRSPEAVHPHFRTMVTAVNAASGESAPDNAAAETVPISPRESVHGLLHTAYIAIGTNVGDRAMHIRRALRYLNDARLLPPEWHPLSSVSFPAGSMTSTPAEDCAALAPDAGLLKQALSKPLPARDSMSATARVARILDSSFLYESEPMYVLDQDRFLNGVVKISTSLTPAQLLKLCKSIESHIGRTKTIAKGPREIDLDLLLYYELGQTPAILQDDKIDLTLPHPLIAEREFVLRPLADLDTALTHPVHESATAELLNKVTARGESQLQRITPLSASADSRGPGTLHLSSSSPTLIMSILNVTPDSFSDGGKYSDVDVAVKTVLQHVADGAHIIDIGGVSTRPGSQHVTEAEELERVIPVVAALRKAGCIAAISIDTYRASVARAAIEAGASIINDVTGGVHDPDMLSTIAELDVPFVLMHMRGKPEEVNIAAHTVYEADDVVGGVRKELAIAVRKALEAGVKRWNIILDPGIGFSKNVKGNLTLLQHLPLVTGRQAKVDAYDEDAKLLSGFPILVGLSRKGFIGKLTGQTDPMQREYGNAALHALAISNGANILRVHDVRAARDAVAVTDAVLGKT